MQQLEMIKCPSCKGQYPLRRKQLGYNVCINCSEEKPKVAVNTVNGQGDHTWNDVLIMDQDKAHNIARRAAEVQGKKVDIELLDLDIDEDEVQRKIKQQVDTLIQSGEIDYQEDTDEEELEEGVDY